MAERLFEKQEVPSSSLGWTTERREHGWLCTWLLTRKAGFESLAAYEVGAVVIGVGLRARLASTSTPVPLCCPVRER